MRVNWKTLNSPKSTWEAPKVDNYCTTHCSDKSGVRYDLIFVELISFQFWPYLPKTSLLQGVGQCLLSRHSGSNVCGSSPGHSPGFFCSLGSLFSMLSGRMWITGEVSRGECFRGDGVDMQYFSISIPWIYHCVALGCDPVYCGISKHNCPLCCPRMLCEDRSGLHISRQEWLISYKSSLIQEIRNLRCDTWYYDSIFPDPHERIILSSMLLYGYQTRPDLPYISKTQEED